MARDPGRSHSSWAAPPNTQSTNSIPAPGIFGIGGKSVALYTRNGTRWDPLESREQGWGKGTEENQGETEHSAPKGKTKDGAEPSLLTLHREKAKSGNISVGCSPAPVFNRMPLLRRGIFMIIKLQLMELQLTEMNQPCQTTLEKHRSKHSRINPKAQPHLEFHSLGPGSIIDAVLISK